MLKVIKWKSYIEIDTMHFFGQLSECMIISLPIDIFMLISYPTDKIYFYFPPLPLWFISNIHSFFYKWFLEYGLPLQMIVDIDNDFVMDWKNPSIIRYFQKVDFLGLICKFMIILFYNKSAKLTKFFLFYFSTDYINSRLFHQNSAKLLLPLWLFAGFSRCTFYTCKWLVLQTLQFFAFNCWNMNFFFTDDIF